MTRDEKIDLLVDEWMTRILAGQQDLMLMHCMLNGFVGFRNMDEAELEVEIEEIKAMKAEEEDDQ